MRFGKSQGYQGFTDEHGRWCFVHVRVMEKKLGGPVPSSLVVHHLNRDKDDNRPRNLVAVTPGVHGRLHGKHPNACFICGRSGHWARDCYARTDYAGNSL